MYTIQKNLNRLSNYQPTFFLDPKEQNELKRKLKKDEYKVFRPFEDSEKVIFYIDEEPEVILYEIKSKQELGDAYNMVQYGGAKYEWYKQVNSLAQYCVGKTAAEVEGIAVDAGTKPSGADLSTSVTIAIGGFKALIAEALE